MVRWKCAKYRREREDVVSSMRDEGLQDASVACVMEAGGAGRDVNALFTFLHDNEEMTVKGLKLTVGGGSAILWMQAAAVKHHQRRRRRSGSRQRHRNKFKMAEIYAFVE